MKTCRYLNDSSVLRSNCGRCAGGGKRRREPEKLAEHSNARRAAGTPAAALQGRQLRGNGKKQALRGADASSLLRQRTCSALACTSWTDLSSEMTPCTSKLALLVRAPKICTARRWAGGRHGGTTHRSIAARQPPPLA